MTRDEAVLEARKIQERTGYPQLISMRSDGTWIRRSLTGRRLTDVDLAWNRHDELDAMQSERETRGDFGADPS